MLFVLAVLVVILILVATRAVEYLRVIAQNQVAQATSQQSDNKKLIMVVSGITESQPTKKRGGVQ